MNITELETVRDILKPMDVLDFRIGDTSHRFIFIMEMGENLVFSANYHVYETDDLVELFEEEKFDLHILRSEEIIKKNSSPFDDISDNLENDEFIEYYFSDVFRSNQEDKEINLEDLLTESSERIFNLLNEELTKRGILFSFTSQIDIINKNQIKSTLIKR